MSKIQLAIEIDERYYTDIKESEHCGNYSVLYALDAIRNGTPLPKGHGRIGDIDELMDIIGLKDNEEYRAYNYGEVITLEDIDRLNVIIEPDKEVSE